MKDPVIKPGEIGAAFSFVAILAFFLWLISTLSGCAPASPVHAQQRVEMDAVRALKDIARETKLLRQEVAKIRQRCNDPLGGI